MGKLEGYREVAAVSGGCSGIAAFKTHNGLNIVF